MYWLKHHNYRSIRSITDWCLAVEATIVFCKQYIVLCIKGKGLPHVSEGRQYDALRDRQFYADCPPVIARNWISPLMGHSPILGRLWLNRFPHMITVTGIGEGALDCHAFTAISVELNLERCQQICGFFINIYLFVCLFG